MTKTGDHANEDGLRLQPLPACLAPAYADRTANPDLALPQTGDAVVITGGHVMFLWVESGASTVTEDDSMVWGAPVTNQGFGAAHWDNLMPCVPGLVPDEDASAEIQAAWDLLIDHANQAETADANR